MSDSTTIARPYAKAIFEHAVDNHNLSDWSETLLILAEAAGSREVIGFVSNPATSDEQRVELFLSLIQRIHPDKDNKAAGNLLCLLAHNKRLLLLPEIKSLYEVHRAEQEKTLSVDVHSSAKLSEAQLQQLAQSLSQRLQRKVTLNTKIDPSLIGGAIIYAGDLVIDGSVRGKLSKLKADLAA